MKLSVLMPVYKKESPEFLRVCLQSLCAQTLQADEVVIVEDGPLSEELRAVIAIFRPRLPIVTLRLPVHSGLGIALNAGLNQCRGEFVARMDADDICVPRRFQKQVDFLEQNQDIDAVGSAIAEFLEDHRAPRSIRRLPATSEELLHLVRYRNPLNHMTVIFRRRAVHAAGGYHPCAGFEDYHLWARMFAHGCRLHNMDEILVYARCGNGMQSRRGGLAYLGQEIRFQWFLHCIGLLAFPEYMRNILVRAPIRLAPGFLRSFCYSRFLREPLPPAGVLHLE